MTLGEIRFRLVKAFPGVDSDLIDGWINDRYAEIMGELPWSRLAASGMLQTAAPYSTGSVTLALGSTSVTGSGTVFTAAMTGRGFRLAGQPDVYEFTCVSATAGTLDRVYTGASASGLAYKIFQAVYVLPSDCRLLEDTAFSDYREGPLLRQSASQLDEQAPGRTAYGTPRAWASYMDDSSVPPNIQVELYPIPDRVLNIPFRYLADADALSSSSAIAKLWMQPAALVEGATAKIKAHLKDYAGAQHHIATAKFALANMRTSEAQGMAPAQMKIDPYYTSHRRRRYCR